MYTMHIRYTKIVSIKRKTSGYIFQRKGSPVDKDEVYNNKTVSKPINNYKHKIK